MLKEVSSEALNDPKVKEIYYKICEIIDTPSEDSIKMKELKLKCMDLLLKYGKKEGIVYKAGDLGPKYADLDPNKEIIKIPLYLNGNKLKELAGDAYSIPELKVLIDEIISIERKIQELNPKEIEEKNKKLDKLFELSLEEIDNLIEKHIVGYQIQYLGRFKKQINLVFDDMELGEYLLLARKRLTSEKIDISKLKK